MPKAPAFQLYARDWLVGTEDMHPLAVAGYITILCKMWLENDCGIAADSDSLPRVSRLGKDWQKHGSEIMAHLYEESGRLYNKKLLSVRKDKETFIDSQAKKGKKSGEARRNKANPGSTPVQTQYEPNHANGSTPVQAGLRTQGGTQSNSASASASAIYKPNGLYSAPALGAEGVESEFIDWFEQLYAQHPKKKGIELAQRKAADVWTERGPEFCRQTITPAHAEQCQSEWSGDQARYAPTLRDWLADRGWMKAEPPKWEITVGKDGRRRTPEGYIVGVEDLEDFG